MSPNAAELPATTVEEFPDVGDRLRLVRTARRRTLREIAAAAGVSESFLSQVERGKSNASVASLRRIAIALGVTIGDLFDEGGHADVQIVRAARRPALGFGVLGRKFHLNEAPDRTFDLLLCEFEPDGTSGPEPYTHGDSEEVVLVLDGSVDFHIGQDVFALERDDSIRYRSTLPHRIVAHNTGARLLFVTAPPSF